MPLTVQDREEIRELIARYNFALDLGDFDAYAACFTADGVFRHTGSGPHSTTQGRYQGRAELYDFAKFIFQNCQGYLRHWNNGTQIIEGDGDTARMRSYIIGFTVGVMPIPQILETGIYYDAFRKVNGRWLIEERQFSCDPQPQHVGLTWDPQKFADEIRGE